VADSTHFDSFDSTEFIAIACIETGELTELVTIGVLEPEGPPWRFATRDLRRLQSAQRLVRDLGVNYAGAALILDLLDERADLTARVAMLERALGV
jgi:chaperone modulatory protein CbpM